MDVGRLNALEKNRVYRSAYRASRSNSAAIDQGVEPEYYTEKAARRLSMQSPHMEAGKPRSNTPPCSSTVSKKRKRVDAVKGEENGISQSSYMSGTMTAPNAPARATRSVSRYFPSDSSGTPNTYVTSKWRLDETELADAELARNIQAQEYGRSTRQRHSKREATPPKVLERYSEKHNIGPPWEYAVEFPMNGKKRAVVEFQDLYRLDDGEFLNDSLLDFYMRYSQELYRPKPKQVHCFNSHFYTRLTAGQRGKIDYGAISRWTKDVDIFEYDYIIVPINENHHWYLAIICNAKYLFQPKPMETDFEEASTDTIVAQSPSLSRSRPSSLPSGSLLNAVRDALGDGNPERPESLSPTLATQVKDMTITEDHIVARTQTRDLAAIDHHEVQPASGNGSKVAGIIGTPQGHTEAPNDGGKFKGITSTLKKHRKKGQNPRKAQPYHPIIVVLDSMGQARSATASCLKSYLAAEASEKKNTVIDKVEIKAMNAKQGIPQQDTWYDCGLYVCGYIDKFMKDPESFGRKLLNQQFDLETDWPEMNALKMRDVMRDLLQNLAVEQAQIRKNEKAKKKKLKREAKNVSSDASATLTALSAIQPSSPKSPASCRTDSPSQLQQRATVKASPTQEPVTRTVMDQNASKDVFSKSSSPAVPKTNINGSQTPAGIMSNNIDSKHEIDKHRSPAKFTFTAIPASALCTKANGVQGPSHATQAEESANGVGHSSIEMGIIKPEERQPSTVDQTPFSEPVLLFDEATVASEPTSSQPGRSTKQYRSFEQIRATTGQSAVITQPAYDLPPPEDEINLLPMPHQARSNTPTLIQETSIATTNSPHKPSHAEASDIESAAKAPSTPSPAGDKTRNRTNTAEHSPSTKSNMAQAIDLTAADSTEPVNTPDGIPFPSQNFELSRE